MDDQQETKNQKVLQLKRQADDMEASMEPIKCEKLHLERIQIVNDYYQSKSRNGSHEASDITVSLSQVYADYGEFCLRQVADMLRNRHLIDSNNCKLYWDKGREALKKAFDQHTSNDMYSKGTMSSTAIILHICCMIESSYGRNINKSGLNNSIEELFYKEIVFPQLGLSGKI